MDGTGKEAIYVYMTYNGQTGHQAWKISGGLNGAILLLILVVVLSVFAVYLSGAIISVGAFEVATVYGISAKLLLVLTNITIGTINAVQTLKSLDCGDEYMGLGIIAFNLLLPFVGGRRGTLAAATYGTLGQLALPTICQ